MELSNFYANITVVNFKLASIDDSVTVSVTSFFNFGELISYDFGCNFLSWIE